MEKTRPMQSADEPRPPGPLARQEIQQQRQKVSDLAQNIEVLGAQLQEKQQLLDSIRAADAEDDDAASYETRIDIRAENNSHSKVLRLLADCPPGRVLDVGCAGGQVGAGIKTFGHEVWGIEMSSRAAAAAAQNLDRVYPGTIEGFLAEHPEERFDHIYFGDVIEHLLSPEEVLRSVAKLLNPGAAIIGSMPNVAHRSVRMMLLEGRFDYEETGIMDRTHLRFYTRDTIVDLLTSAGFYIDHFDGVTLRTSVCGKPHNSQAAKELEAAVIPLLKDSDLDIFQFVFRARSRPGLPVKHPNARFKRDRGPRILCLFPPAELDRAGPRFDYSLSCWRRRFGGEFRIISNAEMDARDLAWCTDVLLYGETGTFELSMVRRLREEGKSLLFAADDLLTEAPPSAAKHDHARVDLSKLEQTLAAADAVVTSSAALQEAMLEYNEKSFLVPPGTSTGHIPVHHWSNEGAKLLIAASDLVQSDFLVTALKMLKEKYGKNLHLIGIGPPGEYLLSRGLDIETHPLMAYDHFKAHLASDNDVIGLLPLDESRYSSCKSVIKYIDYSLAGIPSICSDVPPWSELIAGGETGIVSANSAPAWFAAVSDLLEDPEKRTRLAAAALGHCRNMGTPEILGAAWQQLLESLDVGTAGKENQTDKRETA